MTTHELAKALLALPDVRVVIGAHEPNEDTFDEVGSVEAKLAYAYSYSGMYYDLFKELDHMSGESRDLARPIDVVELRT